MKKNLIKMMMTAMFLVGGSLAFSGYFEDNKSIDDLVKKLNANQSVVAARKSDGRYVFCIPDGEGTSDQQGDFCIKGFKSRGAKTPFDLHMSIYNRGIRDYYYNKKGGSLQSGDLVNMTTTYYRIIVKDYSDFIKK